MVEQMFCMLIVCFMTPIRTPVGMSTEVLAMKSVSFWFVCEFSPC